MAAGTNPFAKQILHGFVLVTMRVLNSYLFLRYLMQMGIVTVTKEAGAFSGSIVLLVGAIVMYLLGCMIFCKKNMCV